MWLKPQELSFEERVEKAMAKHRRSKELFLRVLSKEQRESFENNKKFFVIGGVTKKTYIILNYRHGNIVELDSEATPCKVHCAGPTGVPKYDYLAAQKMWLESESELEFLKTVNSRNLYPSEIWRFS